MRKLYKVLLGLALVIGAITVQGCELTRLPDGTIIVTIDREEALAMLDEIAERVPEWADQAAELRERLEGDPEPSIYREIYGLWEAALRSR